MGKAAACRCCYCCCCCYCKIVSRRWCLSGYLWWAATAGSPPPPTEKKQQEEDQIDRRERGREKEGICQRREAQGVGFGEGELERKGLRRQGGRRIAATPFQARCPEDDLSSLLPCIGWSLEVARIERFDLSDARFVLRGTPPL